MQLSDEKYLQIALDNAKKRQGFCAPNPAVGAVLVNQDSVLAVGHHQGCGHPHAEVEALAAFDLGDLHDATLYVTLEPCCHQGRTPPCTDLLIRHQLKRVVFAYYDPNPKVAGKGQQQLQAAGIVCEHVPLSAIDNFYQAYQWWQTRKRPWLSVKLALSQDEKIADKEGKPVALTGPHLQRFTHQQRQQADALLTTARTIIADDPQLNVRFVGSYTKPLYILDSYLATPLTAKVFHTCSEIIIFHRADADNTYREALQQRGAICRVMPTVTEGVCLASVLDSIGTDGRHHVWVEAGGRCAQALLAEGLVQTLYLYQSAHILGNEAIAAFHSGLTQALLIEQACSYQQHVIGDEIAYQLEFEV